MGIGIGHNPQSPYKKLTKNNFIVYYEKIKKQLDKYL